MVECREDDDLFQNNKCLVCQSLHLASEDEWTAHKILPSHVQKCKAYRFLGSTFHFESVEQKSDAAPFLRSQTALFLGKECIHEFHHEVVGFAFWICSLCYCTSDKIRDINGHLLSSAHRLAYVCNFYPEKKPPESSVGKQLTIDLDLIAIELKEEQSDSLPEVLVLKMEVNGAKQLLGIGRSHMNTTVTTDNDRANESKIYNRRFRVRQHTRSKPKKHYTILELSGYSNNMVLWCNECWQALVCEKKQFSKFWKNHMATSFHQEKRLRRLSLNFYESLVSNEVSTTTLYVNPRLDESAIRGWVWKEETESWHYSRSIVGLDYMIERYEYDDNYITQKKNIVCLLCAQVLAADRENIQNHAMTEEHIIQFVHNEEVEYALHLSSIESDTKKRELIDDWLRSRRFPSGKIKVYNKGNHKTIDSHRSDAKQTSSKTSDTDTVGPSSLKISESKNDESSSRSQKRKRTTRSRSDRYYDVSPSRFKALNTKRKISSPPRRDISPASRYILPPKRTVSPPWNSSPFEKTTSPIRSTSPWRILPANEASPTRESYQSRKRRRRPRHSKDKDNLQNPSFAKKSTKTSARIGSEQEMNSFSDIKTMDFLQKIGVVPLTR